MKKIFSIFLSFFIFVNFCFSQAQLRNGVLQIFDNEQLSSKIIYLDGEWKISGYRIILNEENLVPCEDFLENEFEHKKNHPLLELKKIPYLEKVKLRRYPVKKDFKMVPNCKSEKLPEIIGTNKNYFINYELKILGLKPNFEYSIFSRAAPNSASQFFCNGEKIAEFGKYSIERKEHRSEHSSILLKLNSNENGEINLKIKTSNFSKYYFGIPISVLFAESQVVNNRMQLLSILKVFFMGVLLFGATFSLMNFFRKKQPVESLILAILFSFCLLNNFLMSGNLFFTKFFSFSFEFSRVLQFMYLWFVPSLFAYIILRNSKKNSNAYLISKVAIVVFDLVGVMQSLILLYGIFFSAPQVFDVAYGFQIIVIAVNVLSAVGALVYVASAFLKEQIRIAIYICYYILYFIAGVSDLCFIDYFSRQPILCTEVMTFVIVLFDIIFSTYNNQRSYINSKKTEAILNKEIDSLEKFVPKKVLSILDKTAPLVEVGDCKKINAIVMFINFKFFNEDESETLPNAEFENMHKCVRKIADFVEEAGGIISNYLGDCCTAIFSDLIKNEADENSFNEKFSKKNLGEEKFNFENFYNLRSINCAKKILLEVKKLNSWIFPSSSPKVKCNIILHSGEIVVGEVGSKNRIGTNIYGKSLYEIFAMMKVAAEKNASFLISENVAHTILENHQIEDFDLPADLKSNLNSSQNFSMNFNNENFSLEKLDDLIVESVGSKIKLYKCNLDYLT